MRVLVIAAHPDDEVLGAGGAIARFAAEGRRVEILIFGEGPSAREPIDKSDVKAQAANAARVMGARLAGILGYPDNRLDEFALLDLAREIEKVIDGFSPNLVLTHHAGDLNQDHRQVALATFIACRPTSGKAPEIWCYEVPSSTEWSVSASDGFSPNLFVSLSEPLWTLKMRALKEYKGELRRFPHPRSVKAIDALSRVRGVQAGLRRAEAFWLARKVVE